MRCKVLTTMTKMFIAMLKKFEKLCVIKTHLVFAIVMLMILCGYIMKYRYINKYLTILYNSKGQRESYEICDIQNGLFPSQLDTLC